LPAQSTLATFNLTEAFGVQWPTQNIEMQYNGTYPNPRTTRLMRQDGKEMPYQWISGSDCWDYLAVNGCILVQDGLPAGSVSSPYTATYTLQTGAPEATVTNPVTITSGTCITGVPGWIIANGLGGLCVPQTQSAPYDAAPIQGIQLSDQSWTGGAAGSANLIYTGKANNPLGFSMVPNNSISTLLHTPASSLFTNETTTFIEAGALKTVVQLAYTGTLPAYVLGPSTVTASTSGASGTITLNSAYTDANMIMLYNLGGTQTPPANMSFGVVYYLSNCTSNNGRQSPSTCQVSTSPGATPIDPGAYNGTVDYYQLYNLSGTPGHLTVTLTLYANTPGFTVEYDSNTVTQWFVPMFGEAGQATHAYPDKRQYRGGYSSSPACGYETPLTITSVTTGTPPVVTVSGRLNASSGDQVAISGVQGAAGVNGTFYICNPNQQNGTFQLYSSSACTGSSPSTGGTYVSGGVAKPVYTFWNGRTSRDAFYDLTYNANQIPGATCSANMLTTLMVDDPNSGSSFGWYDFVYNSTISPASSAPVVGLFRGRMSKQFNVADPDSRYPKYVGWYASNSDWITQVQSFGLSVSTTMDDASPITHEQFGVYIGTADQLNSPDSMQPIGILQNQLSGPNLSSMYAYTLCGPMSCYSDPSGGWKYPYYSGTDLAALQSWFGNTTNYNNMVSSAGGSGATASAMYQLWNGLSGASPSTAATTAFNTVMASAGGTVSAIGYQLSNASVTSTPPYTVTATITGPHALLLNQNIGVYFPNQTSWTCNNPCALTALTPTSLSYVLPTKPSGTAGYGTVRQVGMASLINNIANGPNRWAQAYWGYQLFQGSFDNAYPVCAELLRSGYLSTPQTQMCKSLLAVGGSLIWDQDWSCIGLDTTNPVLRGTSCSGANLGLANQNQLYRAYRSLTANTLTSHPYLSTKINIANGYIASNVSNAFNSYGAGPGSLHYQGNYTEPNYQNFQAGALNGQFSFSNSQYPWAKHVQWLLSASTPPEPRFGNLRKCLSDGDGNTEATCSGYAGGIAEGVYGTDRTTSGYAQWMWTQMNPGTQFTGVAPYTLDAYSSYTVNPTLPSITPNLMSINFPGYWSVMRFGFNTPHETSAHFINGDFYSSQGHRHQDEGQLSIYAHNAPLAIDWNANLYNPETFATYCHNKVVRDSDLGALTSWSESDGINRIICSDQESGQISTGVEKP